MNSIRVVLLVVGVLATNCVAQIERRIPPPGISIPAEVRTRAEDRLTALRDRFKTVATHASAADADVLLKAVELALDHGEIYKTSHLALLDETLELAAERIESLQTGQPNWQHDELTVRGFYSRIDDSPQPYGLVIPKGLGNDKPVPLYVWLHGRGDKTTDIHFVRERLSKVGQISPDNAIVLHPFGRQCIGYKSAGETDVLEAINHVKQNYNIDADRVVLMGFSMGGAGAWHLGAHFTDQFVAVSPGAGFAETARYQKLSPEKIAATPWYERTLWSQYDVPNYVRNYFNVPVVCYSGEKDRQIQAARVMEEAFREHGEQLEHVIGPEMGHKYDKASLADIMSKMAVAARRGRNRNPEMLHIQTRTLRYPGMHWVRIDRLGKHWDDSTVDVKRVGDAAVVTTKNIRQLTLDPIPSGVKRLIVDGTTLPVDAASMVLSKSGSWGIGPLKSDGGLAKKPGLQGPIDDAFVERFLVVTPDGSTDRELDRWVESELQHLRDRWASLFRARLPEKRADEVTEEDIRDANLIVFGFNYNNSIADRVAEKMGTGMMKEMIAGIGKEEGLTAGVKMTVSFIYPNPLNPERYVVFNSGPTFREAHDRTNSLQNPKLPDWVVYDYTTPPDAERAARVIRAGFFDENWNIKLEAE